MFHCCLDALTPRLDNFIFHINFSNFILLRLKNKEIPDIKVFCTAELLVFKQACKYTGIDRHPLEFCDILYVYS